MTSCAVLSPPDRSGKQGRREDRSGLGIELGANARFGLIQPLPKPLRTAPAGRAACSSFQMFRTARLHSGRAMHLNLRSAAAAKWVQRPSTPSVAAPKPSILTVGIANAVSRNLNRRSRHHALRDDADWGSRRVGAEREHGGSVRHYANIHCL